MPQPRQPFLHDVVSLVAAPTQALSSPSGDIVATPDAPTAQGVIHDDVRVLSQVELRVDGQAGEHIATELVGQQARFTTLLRHVGADGAMTADPRVRLDRTRSVAAGRVREEIVVTSQLETAVRAVLTVRLAGDQAPMELIRAGVPVDLVTLPEPVIAGLDAPGASSQSGSDGLTWAWPIDLPAGGSATLGWSLTLPTDGTTVVAADSAPRLARPDPATTRALDHRLAPWLERSLDDLDGLRMTTPDAPADVFLAAGVPWYLTLFGRDSLWAARMLLPLDPAPAVGTLRILARRQGSKIDPDAAEEPGKILHEVRRTALHLGDMTLPPLYYGTVDATPLWIALLHDLWQSAEHGEVVAELVPALERALAWIVDYGVPAGGDFCSYVDTSGHGLANQGWKDSADSVRFADGRIAEGPVALCEVQGYAYEAAIGGAAILAAFDRPGAERYRSWAEELRVRFRAAFWCGSGEDRFPALALDGSGQRVDSLTSNIGHLLGTGLLDAGEEELVARRLASPALDSGLGLRTMADTDRGYAPLSYHCGSVWPHDTAIAIAGLHRAGLGSYAAGLTQGLLRASVAFDQRLPELWSGEGRPVPYPAACRPQAWSAAAAVVVAAALGQR